MKGINVALQGEEAVFFWREGEVYAEGYDLESEKAVLALTSYGKGIGVLLVAINASCNTEAEFGSEVKKFVAGPKKYFSGTYFKWPEGQLIFEYLSYSPDPELRWRGMHHARLSERHYQRILAEKEMKFKIWMAGVEKLPEKYFHPLINLSVFDINHTFAGKENCPSDVLEILAKDNHEYVRQRVARNLSCPIGILEILCKDKNEATQDDARQNLARRKDLEV